MGTKRIINMNATTDFESDDNIVVDSETAGTRKMAQSVLKEKLREDCLAGIHNLTPATDFATGDTIVVDNATDGPRGMNKDVLLAKTAQNALGSIKNLSTSITAFRSGDVIPVDGPGGTAKMSKDSLLQKTADASVTLPKPFGSAVDIVDSDIVQFKNGFYSNIGYNSSYTHKYCEIDPAFVKSIKITKNEVAVVTLYAAVVEHANGTYSVFQPLNVASTELTINIENKLNDGDKLYLNKFSFVTKIEVTPKQSLEAMQDSCNFIRITRNKLVNGFLRELYIKGTDTPAFIKMELESSKVWVNVLDAGNNVIAKFDTTNMGIVDASAKSANTEIAKAVIANGATTNIGIGYTDIVTDCSLEHCPIIKASLMDDAVDAKLESIFTTLFVNLSPTIVPALSMIKFYPHFVTDHYNYKTSDLPAEGTWVYAGFKMSEAWKKDHDYFIAIDLEVVTDTKTTGGNFYGQLIAKGATNQTVSNQATPVAGVVTGTRGTLKGKFTINASIDTWPTANNFILQAGNYTSSESLEINVYNVFVIDMGVSGTDGYIDYATADAWLTEYGFVDTKKVIAECQKADVARVAESIESLNVGGDIDLWGDSLVAQNYGSIIASKLGRNVYSHGFGGKNSGYIRDQFLAYADKSNTIIINVGRNDAATGNADKVFQNIAAMVDAIPHENFIICCPPNGNYAGESEGGAIYSTFFETLEERLSKAYPANFLNTREGTIYSYDMGEVRLAEGFTKPNLNASVTIKVTDSEFLTTYNAADVTRYGSSEMEKIAIGKTIDACDVYAVTAHDDDANTITATLIVDGSSVSSGNTFDNTTSGGAVYYARVMQYMDWKNWKEDTTQSTFRADGIHMSDRGKNCLANLLCKKIVAMKI